jgi:hypothetical protein
MELFVVGFWYQRKYPKIFYVIFSGKLIAFPSNENIQISTLHTN